MARAAEHLQVALALFPLGAEENELMALVFLQLAFETFEKGKGVSRGAGKTGKDFTVVQATNFFCVAFHHGIAERNLAVAAHDDFALAAN